MNTRVETAVATYGTIPEFKLPALFSEAKAKLEQQGLAHQRHLSADLLVAIYPGLIDGDIRQSLTRWHQDLGQAKNWLVAGIHHPPHQEVLAGVAEWSQWTSFQPEAYNTPEQARWLIGELQRLAVKEVGLYLPRFHAPRAFGTTVKAAQDAGWQGKIRVVTWDPAMYVPLPLAGFSNQPLYQDLFPGEWKRWVDYTEKGDVAHPSTWGEYLN